MDPIKAPETQETAPARPSVSKVDATPESLYSVHQAFNDFLMRLEHLKQYHPDWDDPRNQSRPFKTSFINFIKELVLRLPVAPEILPQKDGTVLFKFTKRAPRDKWQVMEVVVHPRRHFDMVAKSRVRSQEPFRRTNMARPDYLSDMIQAFYELDHVNTKEHPLRFRAVTVNDYPFIAGMAQSIFGPHACYHPRRISQLLEYAVVADDPMYGILSVAALNKCPTDEADYQVSIMMTVQNHRGLSLASKCLRGALTNCLVAHPTARVIAKSILKDGNLKDVCQSALRRAGFKRYQLVRGERRYTNFDCDRCNTLNCHCDFANPESVCSTAYYRLGDYGGKQGYGGRKPIT